MTADELRRRAAECERRAATATDQVAHQLLVSLAGDYRAEADEVEQSAETCEATRPLSAA